MNIEFLRLLMNIIAHKSISKAAEDANISQSALSQQIKTVENSLGIKIFDRTHKGVELTETGKILYKHAPTIILSCEKMLHEINALQNGNKTLHILATPIVNAYALPCTIYHIKGKYPHYTLETDSLPSDLVEEKIAQGIGDIGFIVGEPKNKALYAKKVFGDQYYLVCGYDAKIPSHINFNVLYQHAIMMLSKTQKTRKILENYCKEIGLDTKQLNVLYELDSIESIKVSAVKGYGLAFLPYMAIKKELYNKQLRIVELEGFHFESHYYAIRSKSTKQASSEYMSLISYVEKEIEETIC